MREEAPTPASTPARSTSTGKTIVIVAAAGVSSAQQSLDNYPEGSAGSREVLAASLASFATWVDESTAFPASTAEGVSGSGDEAGDGSTADAGNTAGDGSTAEWDALVNAVTNLPAQAQAVKSSHEEATAPPPPAPAPAPAPAPSTSNGGGAGGGGSSGGWCTWMEWGATGPFWQWGPCK